MNKHSIVLSVLRPLIVVAIINLSTINVQAACNPDPVNDVGTVPVTNNRYYYLSEIGGCANLACWLGSVPDTLYSNATLVIDQRCVLGDQTLPLPARMVLAGVGMDGEGELIFSGLSANQAAIAVESSDETSGVTIRDLRIAGDNPLRGRGIELDSAHQTKVERVRISEFNSGIYGRQSFFVIVDKANLHNNNINIMQDFTANTWRVTNSILNQATRWGIYQTNSLNTPNATEAFAHQNSSVYDGNRLESNGLGGIRVSSVGTVIKNNEFEGNGGDDNVAIMVNSTAVNTRVLSNFYSGDCPIDNGRDTEFAFDIFFAADCP